VNPAEEGRKREKRQLKKGIVYRRLQRRLFLRE
jgi:hypothetical protein